MAGLSTIFREDEDPVDGLYKLANLVQFLIDLQGHEGGGIVMETQGKEGFLFFLWILKDSMLQIAEVIEKQKLAEKESKPSVKPPPHRTRVYP